MNARLNLVLTKKIAGDGKWLLMALIAYVVFFSAARVFIVAELDTTQFREILDMLPDSFRNFTDVDFMWLTSYVGRIAYNFAEPMIVFAMSVWCIARGSDVVSGALGSGTLEMLLAQPLGRRRYFWIHTCVTVTGVGAIALLTWFGMWLGVQLTSVEITHSAALKLPMFRIPLPFLPGTVETAAMRDLVDCRMFWPGVANLFSLGVFLAGLAVLFSAADRYRWRTIGVVMSLVVVMGMVEMLAMNVPAAAWLKWLSFFSLYEPEVAIAIRDTTPEQFWYGLQPTEDGSISFGPMLQNLLLVASGTAMALLGSHIFSKRDLPAPL